MNIHDNSPHGANDTSEAAKEHRRYQMNGLVGRVSVASGSLTSTQNGEHGIWEVEIYNILDCKVAILQNECAPERIGSMDTVTGKMKDVSRCAIQKQAQL
jgi:hypothetical protein